VSPGRPHTRRGRTSSRARRTSAGAGAGPGWSNACFVEYFVVCHRRCSCGAKGFARMSASQWAVGWARGDDTRWPCFLEERQALNWIRDRLSRGRVFVCTDEPDLRQAACQRSRPSDAGSAHHRRAARRHPCTPAAQNAPGWTTCGEPEGALGAVVGGWVASAPASPPLGTSCRGRAATGVAHDGLMGVG
jgi:hypothetical protein